MKILAIETSCDDTGIAVLEEKNKKFKVLSNIVSSQIEIHKKYGGVFPMMAKREHQRNLLPVLKQALAESKLLKVSDSNLLIPRKIMESIFEKEPELLKKIISFLEKYKKPEVDFIAVTRGPGLEPCLWTGVNLARALSYFWNIPIVPVNHIEAHILVNFLGKINGISNSKFLISKHNLKSLFPVISLIVSGGHTQLILMKNIGDYKIIGETRDDAAGECFDKCAKILGLEYPGGPIVSKMAEKANKLLIRENKQLKNTIHLPRPMINTKDYDFSFSGLKTAVLYKVKEKYRETPLRQGFAGSDFVSEMCYEIQQAIIDVLIKKTVSAAKDFRVKTVILGGGVSANSELRSQFKLKAKSEKLKIDIIFPDKKMSTDNGLMIAVAGFFHKKEMVSWEELEADANLRIGR